MAPTLVRSCTDSPLLQAQKISRIRPVSHSDKWRNPLPPDRQMGTNANMIQEPKPLALHLRIGITATLGLLLVVAGCLEGRAGEPPAGLPSQAATIAAAAKARVRLSVESPPADEPYPCLHGGEFKGPAVPESPDPLVGYRWRAPSDDDGLQSYILRPVAVSAGPGRPFENPSAATAGRGAVLVKGSGSLRFDFGVESAAWLEFDSPDLSGSVEMSISEYNEPAIVNAGAQSPVKTKAPVRHGNTWRLELNKELYEGLRFGWVHVRSFDRPWHITDVRAVCQIKPANYDGRFACSDPLLTRIWYTGAYGVKVNLQKDYFGAILMERCDRFSWTGDAHTSQAAALVAFGNRDFVKLNLDRTAHDSNNIETLLGAEPHRLLQIQRGHRRAESA